MAANRVSIRDVAREAGVSATTVSHALNDKGRLNPETRRKVREVADRLGYRPNPAARSLVSGRTKLIAAMASLPEEPRVEFSDFGYYTELIGAATAAAVDRDYALVVAPPARSGLVWERVPLDGVIVIDPIDGEIALPILRSRGVPFVTAGRDPRGHEGDAVVAGNDMAATRDVLDHLVGRGARQVAMVVIPPLVASARDAAAAYEEWCAERGRRPILVRPPIHGLVLRTQATITEVVADLLARPEPPDAIYAPVERLGVAVAQAVLATGLRIPQDIMLVTTHDAGLAAAFDPSITTLGWDYKEYGRKAGDMLIDLVEGRRQAPCLDLVGHFVTARTSTAR